ncbi:MAG: hypothetical protein IPK96_05710 [Flammeovirgaceae bacterium]|jgi:hypothetical protein|nr:hypothetical protein [Flammeovirgaceae bacterium]
MTSTPTQTPLIVKIAKHLPQVEKVFLAAFILGMILRILHLDSTVLSVSLLGLGVTYFLFGFRPIDIPQQENEKFGFAELLGLMIVPKVLWLSSAISALGIAFYNFDFGNEGYKQMLLIGGLIIGIGTLLLVIFMISGVRHIRLVILSPLLVFFTCKFV